MIQKPFRGIQLNRTHPLAKGLVGCWLFNEMTGETVFDMSSHGNNGTLENGVTWGGDGLEFDGVDDDVEFSPIFSSQTVFTVEAWIKTASAGLMNIVGSTVLNASSFISAFDGYAKWFDGIGWRSSTTSIADNKWHQCIFKFDTGTHSIYVDGVEEYSGDEGNYASGTGFSRIGNHGSYGRPFNGQIDGVRIYNRALSAEEIVWSYKEPYAMFEPAFNLGTLYAAIPPTLKPMWYYNMLRRRD